MAEIYNPSGRFRTVNVAPPKLTGRFLPTIDQRKPQSSLGLVTPFGGSGMIRRYDPEDSVFTIGGKTTIAPIVFNSSGKKANYTIDLPGLAGLITLGLSGTPGLPGFPGVSGVAGPGGVIGVEGMMGFRGPKGEKGIEGPTGLVGEQGPRGKKGPKGPTGDRGPQGPATCTTASTIRIVIPDNATFMLFDGGSAITGTTMIWERSHSYNIWWLAIDTVEIESWYAGACNIPYSNFRLCANSAGGTGAIREVGGGCVFNNPNNDDSGMVAAFTKVGDDVKVEMESGEHYTWWQRTISVGADVPFGTYYFKYVRVGLGNVWCECVLA